MAIVAVIAAALVGCSPAGAIPSAPPRASPLPTATSVPPPAPAESRSASPSPAAPAPSSELQEAALALPLIDDSAQTPAYRRDDFGDGWVDVDRNGCSTRQDVLQRDLVAETLADDGCTVLTGTLPVDPYTGATIEFAHDRVGGDSQAVQIDHIISLSAAHRGGAWAWTYDERVAFANDPDSLLAVDGPTNASKGDRGPADWMPEDPASWCDYAADYTTIALDYGLAVSAADRQMLVDVLTACA
ncbi:MAG: HNH endonuclease family protein [Actinomycetota bacterium]